MDEKSLLSDNECILEALSKLRPVKSFRSYQITNEAQASYLSIGASWGAGKLISIRIGTGSRLLAVPFRFPDKGVSLIGSLRFDEDWNLARVTIAGMKWLQGASLPNFGLRDKEWAWVEYAKVALAESNQINPIFDGKVTTSFYFLKL